MKQKYEKSKSIMEQERKKVITNMHKVLAIIYVYRQYPGNQVVRKQIEPLIKNKYFSDIDDSGLALIVRLFTGIKFKFDGIYKNNFLDKLTDEDLSFFKKEIDCRCERNLDITEYQKIINYILINQKWIDASVENFIDALKEEQNGRERKMFTGIKGSLDDSIILNLMIKKLENVDNIKELEDLLIYYTTAQGCDLINGFLRGDISVFKENKNNPKSSFGTSKKVSVRLFLDTAAKALKLREKIIDVKLKDITEVYRGLGYLGFLKFINITKKEMIKKLKENASVISKLKTDFSFGKRLLVRYINKKQPIYQTNSITSTSLKRDVAINYAKRDINDKKGNFPIFMQIKLTQGVSCGLDFRTFSFGKDYCLQEVVLSPGQKIKLLEAEIKKESGKEIVFIKCETI